MAEQYEDDDAEMAAALRADRADQGGEGEPGDVPAAGRHAGGEGGPPEPDAPPD